MKIWSEDDPNTLRSNVMKNNQLKENTEINVKPHMNRYLIYSIAYEKVISYMAVLTKQSK